MTEATGFLAYQPTYIHPSAVIGDRTRIGAFCDIGRNVRIGKDCNIQAHVTLSNYVRIGQRCFIGPGTLFFNDKYPPGRTTAPIVEDDVIIGGGCLIMPNVHIGAQAVISAGALVTKSVPFATWAQGYPATRRGTRREFEERKATWVGEKFLGASASL